MRALVTGADGFVGAHLAARLVGDGWDVVGTVRPGTPAWRLPALGVEHRMTVVPADLSDRAVTAGVGRTAEPDVAFLLAAGRASATPDERAATVAVNTVSGAWLIDAMPDRCRTVVRLGSSTEYRETAGPMGEDTPVEPRGFFGATKAAGSLMVAAAGGARGTRVALLRAFQVYGPLDHPGRLVPSALRAASTGAMLPLTGPGRRRDWVFVDDVVEACVRSAAADELAPGQVINVGTGRQVANEELVGTVARVTGRPIAVDVGAHAGREWDTDSWLCDPSLARRLLGWEAKVPLDDGLSRCWAALS